MGHDSPSHWPLGGELKHSQLYCQLLFKHTGQDPFTHTKDDGREVKCRLEQVGVNYPEHTCPRTLLFPWGRAENCA